MRIATHPQAKNKGYGTRTLELLIKYYEGKLLDAENMKVDESIQLKAKVSS